MSYKLRKIYKCNICGKEELSEISFGNEGLPNMRWSGSTLQNGICLCDECSRAFRDLKMEYYNRVYI